MEPSEKFPEAVYCWLSPSVRVELAALTVIWVTVAEVTVSCVLPVTDPSDALIVVVPADTADTKPLVGAVVLTVATPVFVDAHVTCDVMFCVLLSLYVPVAKNCSLVLTAMDGVAGVTTIEISAGVTVTANDPPTEPTFALTEHCPLAFAVSIPPVATVAMLPLLEVQMAVAVTSFVLWSL